MEIQFPVQAPIQSKLMYNTFVNSKVYFINISRTTNWHYEKNLNEILIFLRAIY